MIASLAAVRRAAVAASLLFSLLAPSGLLAESRARKTHETSRIYVRLHEALDWDEARTWTLAEAIWRESKKYSLDPLLVLAIIRVESEFRPRVVSPMGARGLMQIQPDVAKSLAGEADLDRWEGAKSLDDPFVNIKFGIFYLATLHEQFGDVKVALTAYNRGPSWVQNAIESKSALPLDYAKKVLSVSRHYRDHI